MSSTMNVTGLKSCSCAEEARCSESPRARRDAFFFAGTLLFASFLFLLPAGAVQAAITEQAPPMDGFFESNPTIGGGAVLPLARFRLAQSIGTDTLTKVGVTLVASSTLENGSVSRLSLWRESGAHPDFQIDEDTFIGGAASTTITTGLLAVLQPSTGVSIPSSGVEFYIVASTTASSGLVNGHGFNVQFDANYASTSVSAGVGSSFLSNRKVSINQNATLKISEVKIGTATNAADEFVELYNSGEAAINLQDLPLGFHKFYTTGSSSPVALTYYRKTIPAHGYFLIANQIGYQGTSSADAVFATSTFSVLVVGGGFSIATSSAGTLATSTAIDRIGFGLQGASNCENTDTAGDVCASALAENGTSFERLAQGYPNATSTAATMAAGGIDATKGNGVDRNDNSAEFVSQGAPNPQNSFAPTEFPFGGGGQDMSTFQVQGSYPGDGMTNVPVDLSFIGFGFNKAATTSTIASASATTTVTLFKVLNSAPTGSNLCSSVIYNPFPGSFEPPAKCNITTALEPSTSYVFTVTSAVRDLSGNFLDQNPFTSGNQNYAATSTTGSAGQTFTNVTPPQVTGTAPFNGSQNNPSNLASMAVEFSTDMRPSTFSNSSITMTVITSAGGVGAPVALSNFSFSTSTGKNVLTFAPDTLAANTNYLLTVTSAVQSANGIPLPTSYTSRFTTGASTDTTAPAVIGVVPTNGITVFANTSDFVVIFDDALDVSTATSGAITLGISGGPTLPGAVRYEPVAKEVHFVPNNILPVGQSLVLTLKGASLKNSSGVYLGTDVTKNWTVEAANSDATGPSVLFVNADEFQVAVTFNEAVNATDATTLTNYSLTVGGVAQTLSSLAGHTITYDASSRTARITGVRVTAAATVVATVQNIKDISGNLMSGTSSGTCTASSATGSGGSGGFVGPGSFSGSTFGERKDFSGFGIGFMPPVSIRPSTTFISATSTYTFELPLARQIDAGGTIVLTFPSSSDFGLCCAATTSSRNPFLTQENSDINGPGTGTVGVQTITKNSTAKTITLALGAATRSESGDTHDFLHFSLADIRNPSVPKGIDGSGYQIDIKSKNSSGALLESFTANPIYIGGGAAGGGATTVIRGNVSGNGGNLEGVSVHLMSPQTGPLDATTDSNGLYQFGDIPVGSQFLTNNFGGGSDYFLFTDPFVQPTGTSTAFFGDTMPTPVSATSTSLLTRDFSLTATSSATDFEVRVTAAANTFGAAEQVDVFAGGPGRFIARTVTPGAGALTNALLTSIPIPQTNGGWGVGIGPAMPKGTSGGFSGPTPAPTWSVPRPTEVVMSGCSSACLTTVGGVSTTSVIMAVSAADKTISGVLKDGSGNAIANAEVFAYSSAAGVGNRAETSTSGAFSVRVAAGSYNVGAFSPGVGKSREVSVVVDSSGNVYVDGSQTVSTGSTGANPFVLRMAKPSYTISGQVTDGSSAVGNASVFAYRTDGPGNADALTDSSTGNYTIYVDNGTWKVSSFIPGFGPMTERTVTVSGSSQSNISFSPSSSANFSMYAGNIYDDADNNNIFATSSEGITGAVIRLSGASGTNEAVSGAQGAFSVRVPSGTGYSIAEIFHPSYGRIAALGSAGTAISTLNLTASSTNNYIRVPKRNTITVNIKDSSGNFIVVSKAFIDLFNTTTKQGTHIEITNASSTSIQVATGTSPTVRAFVQGVPPSSISVASDSTGTAVSSNVVTVDNTTETIKVTVNTSTANLSTLLGTVSDSSGNAVENVWIQFIDETNGVFFGTQATSSGRYNIKAADGTYTAIASKPGYVGTADSVTVSGATTKNFTLTAASLTISGTVTAGGSAASNAFVRAERVGGGQAIKQTDTSGAYSLNVTAGTWRVYAAAEGYSEGAAAGNPITVSVSSVSGKDVALTSTVSLQSKLATSNTFTDTSAATFSDATVKVDVSLDSNTLGSAGNNSYLTAKETSNFPNTATVNIVGSKAKDIGAFSGGSQIKTLQSGKTATVELTYTTSELSSSNIDTTSEVANLKMVSYSDDNKEWEALSTVATYRDSSGETVTSPASDLSNVSSVKFTAVGTHFSAYALSSATGVTPPDTPGGVAATAGTGVGSAITVTWGAVSGAEGYYVYRDTNSTGSFPLLADASGASTATYSDSAVSGGTTYYYKVSAYKSSGSSESAASSAVSALSPGAGGGGSPGGGGGGGASYGPPPRAQKIYPDGTIVYLDEPGAAAKIKELDVKFAAAAKAQKLAAAVAAAGAAGETAAEPPAVSPVFTKDLSRGSRGGDVERLQTLLAGDKEIYPEGDITGFFGPATERALKRFQVKYGVVKSAESAGAGRFGPATRAKIAEVFAEGAPSGAQAVRETVAAAAAAAPEITRRLSRGSQGDDVKRLQEFLASDPALYPEGEVTGFFGGLTRAAVERFQEKYGIAKPGDPGYGEVGPMTRAKLSELRSAPPSAEEKAAPEAKAEPAAPAAKEDSGTGALEKQIQDALRQVEELQRQLKALSSP